MKNNTEHFLSCDWGTTTLRLKLATIKSGEVLLEEQSDQGIAATFNLWQETGNAGTEEKMAFYLQVISRQIKKLEEKWGQPLAGVKVIISGMASSSIGFIDVPYSELPLAIDGSGINTATIPASETFAHDVLVISGVRTSDDVIRGEETQLIGCIDTDKKNDLYIFPGTHSKHITVENSQIIDFKTFMTGEVFELLSQKSILKNAVEPGNSSDMTSFKQGVKYAVSSNLLHAAFKVRTNQLFGKLNKNENYNYLSGLLIGEELKDIRSSAVDNMYLAAGSNLGEYYKTAFGLMEISKPVHIFPPGWADDAVVRGQLKIGRRIKMLP